MLVRNIRCAPGHGINIGSLGGDAAGEAARAERDGGGGGADRHAERHADEDVGRPNRGLVAGVSFARITMRGVRNPVVVVDQNYCPSNVNFPAEVNGDSRSPQRQAAAAFRLDQSFCVVGDD